jgi:hypothetical protein
MGAAATAGGGGGFLHHHHRHRRHLLEDAGEVAAGRQVRGPAHGPVLQAETTTARIYSRRPWQEDDAADASGLVWRGVAEGGRLAGCRRSRP